MKGGKTNMNNFFWMIIASIPSLILGYGVYSGSIFDIDQVYTTTGLWAFRLMVIVLCLTPLRVLFGLKVSQLSQPLGLMVFYYIAIHVGAYLLVEGFGDLLYLYLGAGLGALIIYTLMAITSNRWSQRKLKKRWKTLHRLTHIATWLVIAHIALQEKIDIWPYAITFGIYIILYLTMKLKRIL